MMSKITAFDFFALDFIQSHMRSAFGDWLMKTVTGLGNAGIIWILIAVILLCTKKYRRHGLMLAASLMLGLLIGNIFLKNLIMRPRPCWIRGTELLIAVPKDYSFPSGHTLSSVISAVILTYADKRPGIAAWILAALIAFSRMYLYVHFPTDILGGALLGLIIAFSVIKIFDCIFKKRHNN